MTSRLKNCSIRPLVHISSSVVYQKVLILSLLSIYISDVTQCKLNVDVVFLVDTSSSVDEKEFYNEKYFIVALTNMFHLSEATVQVGVISYNTKAKMEVMYLFLFGTTLRHTEQTGELENGYQIT